MIVVESCGCGTVMRRTFKDSHGHSVVVSSRLLSSYGSLTQELRGAGLFFHLLQFIDSKSSCGAS